jgi:U3 small nucleolar RNA-associated protein 15
VALQVLDLYSDQLGRSEDIDSLVSALTGRVNVLVEASESAWKVLGMVEGLSGGAMDGEV